MNKNFTLHILQGFKKLLLAAIVVITIMAIQSFTNEGAGKSAGVQAKIVKCYPNPAVSFVNFEFTADAISKNCSLQVYSFTGKKMYETGINNVKITLTITNEFYRGIYVYQFIDKSGKILETGKFQVTK